MTPAGPTTPGRSGSALNAPATAAPTRQDGHRELDHRLANSLQLAADFLLFEHTRITDPRARAALLATADRLSAVGQMHRFLASHHQASGVDLDPFLTEFGRLIADSTGLDCHVDAEPLVVVGAEAAQQLAIAVNELAMNAAKHAYPWGRRGVLHIGCRRRGEHLVITVADEGQGLGKHFAAGASGGLGMSIIEAIVRQLRGSFHAASDHGARFTLTVPMPSSSGTSPPRSFSPPTV